MQVSVIIVNYNTQQLTSCCIRSVIDKTKTVSYEIIVVDNGSTSCDPEAFIEEFPSVTLIKSPINKGFAGGNNLGIQQAKGEYILLLNSDTELINDAIDIAIKRIKKDSDIGALSGQLRYPDGRVQPVIGRFPSITNECYELFRLTKFESKSHKALRLQVDLWDYTVSTETDWVWGAFFLFPKKILQQFPGQQLQEDFFMYYEDVLWCYFIKKKLGLKIMYDSDPLILHHLSGSSLQANLKETFVKKSLPNQYVFIKKQHGFLYCKLYFFIKGLHLLSLRKKEEVKMAKIYFSFVFNYRNTHQ
jgi:GT2 family glycosyltransferase